MTAEAVVDRAETNLLLTDAPDLDTRWGEPFVAEKAAVYWWPQDGGAVWVTVSGRAILKSGGVGKRIRHRVFDLVTPAGQRQFDPSAPEWLVDALNAAGVTW